MFLRNPANFYEAQGNLDIGAPFSSTATCNTGDSATGGGLTINGDTLVTSNSAGTGGTTWEVSATALGTSSLQAFAQCYDNSP